MDVDFGEMVELSFRWLKLKDSWKYAFLIWGTGLLTILFAFVLALMMFSQMVIAVLSGDVASLTQLFKSLAADPAALIGFFAYVVLFVVILSIFSFFVSNIASVLTLRFGLRSNGFKTPEFTINKYFSFLGLLIAGYLAALFYSFNKTARIIQWAALALTAGCFALFFFALSSASSGIGYGFNALASLSLLLGLAAFVVWIIISVYNSLMMTLNLPIFLSEEIGVIDSLKKSWKLMTGNLWTLVIASFIVGIVSLLVVGVSQVILSLLLSPLVSMLMPSLASLKLASSIASNIAEFILGPVSVFINVFFLSAFYAKVLGKAIPKIV